ncbi:MAG: NADH-quinone oxidoreductase subunit M [Bacteroidota bacterium]
MLSLLIFIPLGCALLVALLPNYLRPYFKYIALAVGLIQSALVLLILSGYNNPVGVSEISEFQYTERLSWINIDLASFGRLSAEYFVAVDGLSISMVVLSVLVLLVGVISSWNIVDKAKGYFSLYLLLNASIIGCFVALDFLLFYLFFEFMLLPMYFLIGLWGGKRRDYASIKFFLYTLLGSIFILIAMIGLYISTIDPAATAVELSLANDLSEVTPEIIKQVQQLLSTGSIAADKLVHTFNMVHMTDAANLIPQSLLDTEIVRTILGYPARLIIFLLLLIGFAIKIPVVPLHTWLPDAHVEAPTPISVILAGILLKVGGYGLMRTAYLMFPDGAVHFAWFIGLLGVVSIIYGAMNALASQDLKRLIAYSSVSHMGFVLFGLASLTSEGVTGAIYQMFSHGIISAALFLVVGVIYDRTNNRLIDNYSGLAAQLPKYTVITVIFFFASMGLPGFSGFIAEIFVLLGGFASATANDLLPRWMTVVAAVGLILSAAYYLWTLQRMFFGKFNLKVDMHGKSMTDLSKREWLMFVPLVALALIFGIFPGLLIDLISPSVNAFIDFVGANGLPQVIVK